MRRIILITLTLAAFLAAQAQELEVKEFRAEINNTYASQHAKKDYNGNPCGVILLSLPEPDAKFEGDIISAEYDKGEWRIHMSKDANWLNIKTDKYAPVRYDFPEGLNIKGNTTYIMTVQVPKQMSDDEMLAYLLEKGFSLVKNNERTNGDKATGIVAEGDRYYEAGNYTEALRRYRQAADQGDTQCQFNVGYMYITGQGVEKDYNEAVRWFRKAAEHENRFAQGYLGWLYLHGFGVTQDYPEAVKWLSKAAEKGDDAAQCNLGWMYRDGLGVQKSDAKAIEWYRRAAEGGNLSGQTNLGWMYYKGYGIEKDYKMAFKWFSKAAEKGYKDAQELTGLCYETGRGVQQSHRNAVKWYRKAAEQGSSYAQEALIRLGEY